MVRRPAMVGMAMALLVTGCGVAATPAVAPVRAVAMQAAPVAAQQAVLQIDRASRWDNSPSTPARTGIRLSGRDGDKKIQIEVQTLNRSWSFYVPTLDKVLVNGKQVTDPKVLAELPGRLYVAEGNTEAKWLSQQASHIVRFGVKFPKASEATP